MFSVIYSPDLALQAAVRMESLPSGKPVALLEEVGKKSAVTQMSASARAAGVRLGMTAPQAIARCGEVVLRSRTATGDEAAREVLTTAAFTLSPRVEETEEEVRTIDLRGVEMEGFAARGEKLVEELEKLGLAVRIGAGGNPLLALLAARWADPVLVVTDDRSFLAELPVAAADPSARMADILEQWGVRTLGALSRLPRHQVARRLGVEGIALWDRACGRGERVLRLATLPEKFEEHLELEHEVETLEPLLFLLRRFIGQLSMRLETAYRVAEEVSLELELADGSRYERSFRLPEPTREAEVLFRMLHTHLEGVRTEFGIVSVGLRIVPCRPVSKQQDLFSAALKDPYEFSETMARLVAVAGSGNVGSPRLEPTHRPDAFRLEPLGEIQGKWEKEKASPVWAEGLPMWRYRPPVRVRVRVERGRPVAVDSRILAGGIRQVRGPWRLSGDWWEPRRWAREEWDVEMESGGIYRLVREKGEWFLEGTYGG